MPSIATPNIVTAKDLLSTEQMQQQVKTQILLQILLKKLLMKKLKM